MAIECNYLQGHLDILKYFTANLSIDINVRGYHDNTFLNLLLRSNQLKSLRALLLVPNIVNIQKDRDYIALHEAWSLNFIQEKVI